MCNKGRRRQQPPARRLLAAPDLLLLGTVASAPKLHDLALAERQHGSLFRRLTVSGDARQHDDMVAVGDKVLRLGPEGLAGQCDEELPDFVLAAIGAADRAVARHDPFDVVGHVPHRTVEVGIRKRLVRGLCRGLVVGCGHWYLPVLASLTLPPNHAVCVAATVPLCLLYTSDAADDLLCVDLGGRRII